jgi:hypothetical protein
MAPSLPHYTKHGHNYISYARNFNCNNDNFGIFFLFFLPNTIFQVRYHVCEIRADIIYDDVMCDSLENPGNRSAAQAEETDAPVVSSSRTDCNWWRTRQAKTIYVLELLLIIATVNR